MSTEVELLRRAAAMLRHRAHQANTDDARRPYGNPEWAPVAPDKWGQLVDNYLGGTIGAHCAALTPAVALAVADWLDTCAGIWAGDADWVMKVATTHGALEVARAYLGEVRDAQDS